MLPGSGPVDDLVERPSPRVPGVDLETISAELLQQLPMAAGKLGALGLANGIRDEVQRPPSSDPGVLLAQRAGGRIAGIQEHTVTPGELLVVDFGERGERKIDLASHLVHRRRLPR